MQCRMTHLVTYRKQPGVMNVLSFLLMIACSANAFLFIGQKRADDDVSTPTLKVAVLEEEPFLFKNGSGYIPELFQEISLHYKSQHSAQQPEGQGLQLNIVPVRTWEQLMSETMSSQNQLGFGLILPSLKMSSISPWKSLYTSAPLVMTSVSVVSKNVVGGDLDDMRSLSNEVVVLRGSPEEHLLIMSVNNYPGSVHVSDTLTNAVEYLRSADSTTIILTDAITANEIVKKNSMEYQKSCPKSLPGSDKLHFGFFGLESASMNALNKAILRLQYGDRLSAINSHYIGENIQC